jgi:acyl-CoA thioesterase-1
MLRKLLVTAAVLILLVTGIPASAAPLSTSAWCQDHASLAVLGASDSTGSFTTGYASPDETYWPTTYGWPSRIDYLTGVWNTTVDNYARNGAQTSDFLPGGRFPITTGALAQIQTKQPSLVLITLGGNEYLNNVSPSTFQANLTTLVQEIHRVSPRSGILLISLWHIARTNPPYQWQAYADAMFNVAVTELTALIDLRQYIPPSDQDTAGLYVSDRIHLSDAGHMVEAAAVWTWLISC